MSGKISSYRIAEAMTALAQARDRVLAMDPTAADDDRLLADTIEGEAEGDPMAVIDALVAAAIHANDMAEIAHVRATELAERKARFKRRNEQLRGVVQEMLTALDIRKLERVQYTASIRAGTPHVVVTDIDDLPEIYVRTKREPDKAAILAALKGGYEFDGATLSNSPYQLALRTK
jgi:phosphosulfolactate phosphohydrolase-like enzyme